MDDDEAVRAMMKATPERKGFSVVSAASVTEALKLITTQIVDLLITDPHMPNPSDGFAVITAMRHSQPDAIPMLVSGYPDVRSAMDTILLQADDIIVKPFEAGKVAVHEKLLTCKPAARTPKERVAEILQRCTGDLPKLIEDLIVRLKEPNPSGKESTVQSSAAEAMASCDSCKASRLGCLCTTHEFST